MRLEDIFEQATRLIESPQNGLACGDTFVCQYYVSTWPDKERRVSVGGRFFPVNLAQAFQVASD